ncbi:MAG: S9 family peptidase [Bacteriovoracaceae bacterium]
MNLRLLIFSVIFFFSNLYADAVIEPKAEMIPTKLEKHGDVRIDNYFWMKDKKNEKVIDYLKAENSYFKNVMDDTTELQEKLYSEMRKRVKEEDQSVPYKKNGYFYYSKVKKGQEYPILYRKQDVNDAEEEVLLNINELAEGFSSVHVSRLNVHSNNELASYGLDTKGDRIYTIYFKDLKNKQILNQTIPDVTSSQVWAESGRVLFYVKQDAQTLRANQVFSYNLDTGVHTLIYEEKDEKFEVDIYKTLSKKFIMIYSASTLSSEVRFIPADKPTLPFKLFQKRKPNLEYSLDDGGSSFIIRTNLNAKNFKVMEASYNATNVNQWRDIIAHKTNVFIEELEVMHDYLIINSRQNGLMQLMVYNRKTRKSDFVKFLDPAYVVSLGTNAEFDSHLVRYHFESLKRPMSVFDYDMNTQKSTLLKVDEVEGFDPDQYVSKRLFVKAKDSALIPVSIVYKNNFKQDGSNPLLIYGYGSYGMSSDPNFDANVISLLDRGFVYAIAHVRGGAEMGRAWYEDGKFLKKKNTFTDFITVTEFLSREKYGNPKKLYAIGGSAGGLLMGAILNMRPDLYNGVIALVPFVDVVTTMLDSTLPLTTGEYEEWGNPNNLKYYKYMLSYSPYDNVKNANYPNILVRTGLNDSQVSYWEPSKWVAKLREKRTDKSKLLIMNIEMDVGHGGKSGRFEYLKTEAANYSFLLKLENIKE